MSKSFTTASASEIVAGLLEQNTPVRFQACGPSMHPTIRDGETVQVVPVDGWPPAPGGIYLCRIHDRLVLHRLARRKGDCFVFRGDASLRGDDRAGREQIIGRAVSVRRGTRELRLDTPLARWKGRVRMALRPLRRLLFGWIHRPHDRPAAS